MRYVCFTTKHHDGFCMFDTKTTDYRIGIAPDGSFLDEARRRLAEVGAWMRVNGEAIHASRAASPHRSGAVRFTTRGRFVYAFVPFSVFRFVR